MGRRWEKENTRYMVINSRADLMKSKPLQLFLVTPTDSLQYSTVKGFLNNFWQLDFFTIQRKYERLSLNSTNL